GLGPRFGGGFETARTGRDRGVLVTARCGGDQCVLGARCRAPRRRRGFGGSLRLGESASQLTDAALRGSNEEEPGEESAQHESDRAEHPNLTENGHEAAFLV